MQCYCCFYVTSIVSNPVWPHRWQPTTLPRHWDSQGKNTRVSCYFLPHFREVFNYYLFKYFLMAFLFVFFFWDSYDMNVGAFDIVPEVSEVVLISFDSFFFFPLCFIYFHHFIFYHTYPNFCLRYSTVCSLQCFLLHSLHYSGEANGTPLQFPCLENPMDGGAW